MKNVPRETPSAAAAMILTTAIVYAISQMVMMVLKMKGIL